VQPIFFGIQQLLSSSQYRVTNEQEV